MNPAVQSDLWIYGSQAFTFSAWKEQKSNHSTTKQIGSREEFLMRKYSGKWVAECTARSKESPSNDVDIISIDGWLKMLVFSPSSRQARSLICSVLDHLAQVSILYYSIQLQSA